MDFLKRNLFWISFLLLLFYGFSVLYRSDSSFDQDLGRHLKLGEIIFNSHSVPKTNLFSYTYPYFQFINHHFLFGVILYIWNMFLNLEYFLYVKILIFLISILLILLILKNKRNVLILPLGYLFLHVLRERTDLRPEIFSFLFTSLSLFILESYYSSKKSKIIFLLPLIQFLWINMHIYFFMGFLLQSIYLIDFFIKRELKKFKILLSVLIISAVISLFNPNGLSGILYPLQVFGNYGYTVAENQNIFLLESLGYIDHNFLFAKISGVLIILSIFISFLKKPFSIKDNLIALLGLSLAVLNIRSFPYLLFLSFPLVINTLKSIELNKKTGSLIVVSIFLLIFEAFMYLNGDYYKKIDVPVRSGISLEENGKKALDYVLQKNLPQPIYNNFDIGSYIIYRGYPEFKVFVDGRPEAYPADFFTQTYIPSQTDYSSFKELDNKYGFQTIVFSITDQTPWGQNFLKNTVRDKDWSIVYLDDFMIILVKSDQLRVKHLSQINLAEVSAEKYDFSNYFSYLRLSYFLSNLGYPESAKNFSEKALSLNPESRIANSLMLNFISKTGNPDEAYKIPLFLKGSENNLWW